MCLYKHLAAEQQHWRRDNTKKQMDHQLTSSLCRYIDPWYRYYYCFSVHCSAEAAAQHWWTDIRRCVRQCQTCLVAGGWWLVAGLGSITNICIYIPCLMYVGNCCLGLVIRGWELSL